MALWDVTAIGAIAAVVGGLVVRHFWKAFNPPPGSGCSGCSCGSGKGGKSCG